MRAMNLGPDTPVVALEHAAGVPFDRYISKRAGETAGILLAVCRGPTILLL
jgi:hypothetical protein